MKTATSIFLQENIWPIFRSFAIRQGLWWMQDGGSVHRITAAKEFLLNKFGGSVIISRGTQIAWPVHSPDFNPLDFCYWTLAQKEVYSAKPTTVDELINVVKRFSEKHRENVLHSVALNVMKRSNLCV